MAVTLPLHQPYFCRCIRHIPAAIVRHFVDPSLAVAALGTGPERLLRDLRFLGLLFESMVVRDLRVYAQAADAEVFHYRKDRCLEVDAVVQGRDGRWAAFEVKLGPRAVEEGARILPRLAGRVDPDVVGPPRALGVLVRARPRTAGASPVSVLARDCPRTARRRSGWLNRNKRVITL